MSHRVVVPRRVRLTLFALTLLMSAAAVLPVSSAFAARSVLTLDQAVHRAVERAPSLLASRARAQAAEEATHNAAALPDPKLTFGIQDLPVDTHDAFNPSIDSFTMKKVGLMQEIPARAKRQARQDLANSTLEQAIAMTLNEDLAVRRSAAEAWVALWASERSIVSLLSLREEAELAVQIAKARLRGGTGTAADALAARGAQLELENRIDSASAAVAAARATLARWIGADVDVVTASGAPDFTCLPVTEARLLATVDQQTPLLPWQAREEVAAAQLGLARAETRPDWSIGVSYGQRDRYSELMSVEVGVSLPLFPGERQDRTTAARRANYEASLDEHEDARRIQAEQIRRDLANWDGLKRRVTRDEKQTLPVARDRVQAALAAYRGGAAIQSWLDARRDELEIHSTHVREDGELGRAWAALAYLLPEETTP
jgi:cobalt-zinc-cadmium efflux system outer membrane protein